MAVKPNLLSLSEKRVDVIPVVFFSTRFGSGFRVGVLKTGERGKRRSRTTAKERKASFKGTGRHLLLLLVWTLFLVCSSPVRSGAHVCPRCWQGVMSWQPHCSHMRLLLCFHSACTLTACTRTCFEFKLLLYEICPPVESASFPEVQDNTGDQEICSFAFTTVQSYPV